MGAFLLPAIPVFVGAELARDSGVSVDRDVG